MAFRTTIHAFIFGNFGLHLTEGIFVDQLNNAHVAVGLHHEIFSHQISIPRQVPEAKQ
jgi:hypothetical protein